jgi:hypothetical protein
MVENCNYSGLGDPLALVLPNWGHTRHTPARPCPDPGNADADTHSPPCLNTDLTPPGDTLPLPPPLCTR